MKGLNLAWFSKECVTGDDAHHVELHAFNIILFCQISSMSNPYKIMIFYQIRICNYVQCLSSVKHNKIFISAY